MFGYGYNIVGVYFVVCVMQSSFALVMSGVHGDDV